MKYNEIYWNILEYKGVYWNIQEYTGKLEMGIVFSTNKIDGNEQNIL